MSLFETTTVPCPSCGTDTAFEAVNSVNADRRPDLRDSIIEGDFQRQECGNCGKAFRLDPQLNYLDVGRNQWIAAYPFNELERWNELEGESKALFDIAWGEGAPELAREMGGYIKPRVVFGWPALWEKLAVDEHGLDDIQLELCKVGLIKNLPDSPLGDDVELRFLEIPEDGPQELAFAWLDSITAEFLQGLRVPRELYDDVAENAEAWAALRSELEGRLFVDMNRLLTVGA